MTPRAIACRVGSTPATRPIRFAAYLGIAGLAAAGAVTLAHMIAAPGSPAVAAIAIGTLVAAAFWSAA